MLRRIFVLNDRRTVSAAEIVETRVPARLERLPWGRFHTLVVVALGITWILDGLEVTLAGSLAGALKESPVLALSNADVGFAASAYLLGAVLGALGFGWLTDRLGRKKLFFITLAVYIIATAATAFSWDVWSFIVFRFFTGAGIGGEYTAINSAIQELIPARYRGRTDLMINGSFWVGAVLAAMGALVLLDPAIIVPELGWRLAFFIGAALGLFILVLRSWLPESPRWLMTHGRAEDAVRVVERIEAGWPDLADADGPPIRIRPRTHTPMREALAAILITNPRRTFVGLTLMASQAFFYNAIFFTYALVLMAFYGVPSADIGWYILPFAAGNFLGPVMLGHLFDTIGRRVMIAGTYALSGVLLTLTGLLFVNGMLSAVTQTLCWSVIFFFASCAASSAYLTVGETFPLEVRALAIAVFYAFGTGIGGVAGPAVFAWLVETGSREAVFGGYLFGSVLMLFAAGVMWCWGIAAERQPLETVARPLALE